MRRLVRGIRNMLNLTDLHLVNLIELEPLMDILAESIKGHKALRKLDLRQNNLRTRDVSFIVPLLKDNKVLEELDISNAVISKINMQHLWLSLHVNISVTSLTYSRINFLALDE